MKVYEIGMSDHYDDCSEIDCTIWIASNRNIRKISNDENCYVKEIESSLIGELDTNKEEGLKRLGVDLIIE